MHAHAWKNINYDYIAQNRFKLMLQKKYLLRQLIYLNYVYFQCKLIIIN